MRRVVKEKNKLIIVVLKNLFTAFIKTSIELYKLNKNDSITIKNNNIKVKSYS